MDRTIRAFLLASILVFSLHTLVRADEGMYPISEIHKLNLKAKGFRIDSRQIYNPKGISLIDAIVNIGGCTGSFVSKEGLILTNHHCAFPALQAATTTAHDYIAEGFLARTRGEEIPAKGNSVRIVESYRDVSAQVLGAVNDRMDPAERSKAIAQRVRDLVAAEEKKQPGKRIEIAEMFAGRSYLLFVYTFLRDVRLVYVPPRSIGDFGGENDNWTWPRHNGDFSFMRAYVAPDGSPAEYSPANVPYRPKKFLTVNPAGVREKDFVFILGYPGRTFRHRTSHYLEFEQRVRMPAAVDWYRWMIDLMDKMGKGDRAVAIQHAARIKSLANTEKNYRGKLAGMRRLDLVEDKRREEDSLQAFILADSLRERKYGSVLKEIGAVYDEMAKSGEKEFLLDQLRGNGPILLSTAFSVLAVERERTKPDAEREAAYQEKSFAKTKGSILAALQNYHEPTDRLMFREILRRTQHLPPSQRIEPLDGIFVRSDPFENIEKYVPSAYANSILANKDSLAALLNLSAAEIAARRDPFLDLARALQPEYRKLLEIRARREGTLNRLAGLFIDVKQEYRNRDFIPDANGTLRLTFGRVKGYSPADATSYGPLTSVRGMIEKNSGVEPYDASPRLLQLHKIRDFGRFALDALDDVPIAMLYDMDTTGGNSGSPVMNAKGELVGVNFDRTYEATINDYAWNANYSRSIGADIRFILWVTQKVAGAGFILKEMGVN